VGMCALSRLLTDRQALCREYIFIMIHYTQSQAPCSVVRQPQNNLCPWQQARLIWLQDMRLEGYPPVQGTALLPKALFQPSTSKLGQLLGACQEKPSRNHHACLHKEESGSCHAGAARVAAHKLTLKHTPHPAQATSMLKQHAAHPLRVVPRPEPKKTVSGSWARSTAPCCTRLLRAPTTNICMHCKPYSYTKQLCASHIQLYRHRASKSENSKLDHILSMCRMGSDNLNANCVTAPYAT
jgi:hypothetical protein